MGGLRWDRLRRGNRAAHLRQPEEQEMRLAVFVGTGAAGLRAHSGSGSRPGSFSRDIVALA
jgi:hypothetical protein